MGIVGWIVMGLVAGALARMLVPASSPRGCLMTVLLGMAGAVVGGFVGTRFGWGDVQHFDLRSTALATLGAVLILAGARLIQNR